MREYVSFTKGDYVYMEYINGERQRYKINSDQSVQELEKISSAFTFYDCELQLIRTVLENSSSELEISPSYYYVERTRNERNRDAAVYREELDALRKETKEITPEGLLTVNRAVVSGIYIIHNHISDKYYVGQSKNIFKRARKHFLEEEGNKDVYRDYFKGDIFTISIIPLGKTSYSTLNELEDIAIRAYEAYPYGYNRMSGNILDRPIFKNDEHEKVAEILLTKIGKTKWITTPTERKERIYYTAKLLKEFNLPRYATFINAFAEVIKIHQESNK